jgi:hypothetical protein
MKALRITVLALLLVIGGGYLGRDGLVRVLDQHFYESTLSVCVAGIGLLAPDRLPIELRSFCNIAIVARASEAYDD